MSNRAKGVASDGPRGVVEWARRIAEDVEMVFRADPAARSRVEVLVAYPGLHAVWMHRASHALWKRGLVLAPRLIAHATRFATGVEIHPGATLGRRVFIDHGMGVVIGETAVVGDDCLIYKGAVLGGTSLSRGPRHPRLGRGVVVGTNACILGRVEVGKGARVGSGSVVIRDVPEGATVVGVPARNVEQHDPAMSMDLNHANLPDPIAQVMRVLAEKIERLEARMDGGKRARDPRLALAAPKKPRRKKSAARRGASF